jgi:hypothetical protein
MNARPHHAHDAASVMLPVIVTRRRLGIEPECPQADGRLRSFIGSRYRGFSGGSGQAGHPGVPPTGETSLRVPAACPDALAGRVGTMSRYVPVVPMVRNEHRP